MGKEIIPVERVAKTIFMLRGERVMLGQDLAALYGVTVSALTHVKRNQNRFPNDFAFQLASEEFTNLKSQFVISSWGGLRRARPYAFTEQGVAMLSSILNSGRAGERTRLACWRWRPRHRELSLRQAVRGFATRSTKGFPAGRGKQHARRVCSPILSA